MSTDRRPGLTAGAPPRGVPRNTSPPPDGPALYVSPVDGQPVTRLPVDGRSRGSVIGALKGEGRSLKFDTKAIVMIPPAEMRIHGKVYERALADGALTKRTEAEFEVQRRARKDATKKAADAAKTPAAPAGG